MKIINLSVSNAVANNSSGLWMERITRYGLWIMYASVYQNDLDDNRNVYFCASSIVYGPIRIAGKLRRSEVH